MMLAIDGWFHSTNVSGIITQYNFVKPHQTLEGQTPAQRAGMEIKGKNKWLCMLEKTHQNDI